MNTVNTEYRAIKGILAAALFGAAVCLYQWVELYELRTTGKIPGCAVNTTLDCAVVWNSPLSISVHQLTGIPFPGWGLVWCIATIGLAVPLLIGANTTTLTTRAAALRLVTGSGAFISLALAGYSLAIGTLCPTCLAFYLSTAVAAFLTFRFLNVGNLNWTSGMFHGVGWVVVPVLLMIYPGRQIPQTMESLATVPQTPQPASVNPPSNPDDEVTRFVKGLSLQAQQALSDTLNVYRLAQTIPREAEPARVTSGKPGVGVHIVEWIDIKCPHCRSLHSALQEIKRVTRPEAWFLESRNFPLDGNCNAGIPQKQPDDVRCIAASVLICLSGSPEEPTTRQKLFDAQDELTTAKVWEIVASDPNKKAALNACVSDINTTSQLRTDLEYAKTHGIEGTPLVVINGKKAPAWPPLLLALILANGDAQHPGFSSLPPAKPMPDGG